MQSFDLAVIGTGSGNSIVDEQFADQRVALIDAGPRFGGTCLNYGCIPTKMFVLPADLAASGRLASRLGVTLGQPKVDWPAIRDRVFGRIDPISEGGERWREENANVALFREECHFVGERELQVGEQVITAERIVLAAGSRPMIPDLPGLADPAVAARVHTSDTIMRLDALPQSLVIIGGGVVAAEFAHVFSSYGSFVTVLQRSARMLSKEDEDISSRFTELIAESVNLRLNQQVTDIVESGRGTVQVLTVDSRGVTYNFEADVVLVATGRVSNADTLNLSATGVAVDATGHVVVDEFQRTTAPGIFALGDVSSPWQLKHVANHEARVVQHNLLHPDAMIASDHRFVPQAVFSNPQVATVGLTEAQVRALGRDYVTAVQDYGSVAYGWALEDTTHLAKLIADPDTGLLLGAHLIGPQASTLIQPLIQAMSFGLDARTMARGQYWIHPALTEVVENALLALPLR